MEDRTTATRPRRPAPRRVLDEQGRPFNGPGSSGSPTGAPGGWGGQEAERIRRAERLLLDIWSGEDFNKVGGRGGPGGAGAGGKQQLATRPEVGGSVS